MRNLTTLTAIILILLGVGLYVGTGSENVTALIPAFFGVGLGICAALARTDRSRKHAMHVALLLALLGLGGSAWRAFKAFSAQGIAGLENPIAVWGQVSMAVICLVFIVAGIRSFRAARRAREAS